MTKLDKFTQLLKTEDDPKKKRLLEFLVGHYRKRVAEPVEDAVEDLVEAAKKIFVITNP